MTPLDKLKLANKLKRVALASDPHIGVTIIVHEKEPGAGGTSAAVATTLALTSSPARAARGSARAVGAR